jgi:hypothetical protein
METYRRVYGSFLRDEGIKATNGASWGGTSPSKARRVKMNSCNAL